MTMKIFIPMKTVFAAVGSLALLLGIFYLSVMVPYGRRADQESKAYVDEVVPRILSSWSAVDFSKEAAAELLRAVPEDKLASLFQVFSKKLGRMKTYKGSTGGANIVVNWHGPVISGNYACQVEFENGRAQVLVRVVRQSERWHMAKIFINSPLLVIQ